jgi:hypothetical protein
MTSKILLFILLVLAPGRAETPLDMTPDGRGGFRLQWDPVQDQLIGFRDADQTTTAAIRIFDKDGAPPISIQPLQDLPLARKMSIWGVAATPDKGVIAGAVLDYGSHKLRSVLLSFDRDGALKKIWNVDPYHHHQIAVDRDGNVFAFGDRGDNEEDGTTNYPLLVKYSPDAKVLKQFLYTSAFTTGDEVVSTSALTGEHQMFVSRKPGELILYLSTTQELLVHSTSGDLKSRTRFSSALHRLAEQAGVDRAHILVLGQKRDSLFVAQIGMYSDADPSKNRFAMAEFSSPEDLRLITMPSARIEPGFFLGADSHGRLMFLEKRGDSAVLNSR